MSGDREWSFCPYVSVGLASYAKGDDILSVKENADNDMYRFKKAHKETM
ncbi:MAG: hypothetical protein V8Q42_00335 [Anaerovoracaceae bacterium]